VRARFLAGIWSETDEHAEARFELTQREHGLCLSHLPRMIRHIVHEVSFGCAWALKGQMLGRAGMSSRNSSSNRTLSQHTTLCDTHCAHGRSLLHLTRSL
jgi:hypothetical protein